MKSMKNEIEQDSYNYIAHVSLLKIYFSKILYILIPLWISPIRNTRHWILHFSEILSYNMHPCYCRVCPLVVHHPSGVHFPPYVFHVFIFFRGRCFIPSGNVQRLICGKSQSNQTCLSKILKKFHIRNCNKECLYCQLLQTYMEVWLVRNLNSRNVVIVGLYCN